MPPALAVAVTVAASAVGFIQQRQAQKQQKKAFAIQQQADADARVEQRKAELAAQKRAENLNRAQRLQEIRTRRVQAAQLVANLNSGSGISSSGQAGASSITSGLVGNLSRADTLANLDSQIADATGNANQILQDGAAAASQATAKASSAKSNADFFFSVASSASSQIGGAEGFESIFN